MELGKVTLYPTHTCFDDSLDLVLALVRENPDEVRKQNVFLVHGVCLLPDGTPYAHAWVEIDEGGGITVLNAVLRDGMKVYGQFLKEQFYQTWRVEERIRYSLLEAYENCRQYDYSGPWEDRYRVLCRDYRP
jgi:hypothetical protein